MIEIIEKQKQGLIEELQGLHKEQEAYAQRLSDIKIRSTQIAGALVELTKLQEACRRRGHRSAAETEQVV